jgi:catechol-2,3-dioxygenase
VPDRVGWPTWLGIVVDDLTAMSAFYRDALGFRQIEQGDDWVHFDVDGHLLELIRRSSLPEYDQRRYQVGYTVDDIDRVRESLVSAGVQAISDIEGGDDTANRWCYFRDPEGNVFEITEWKRDWRETA